MKKANVRAQRALTDEMSPFRVIAHARWAAQRGRNPSMTYRGECNPRRALQLALADIGATMADLHTVELHEVAVPLQVAKPGWHLVRRWVHSVRLTLRGLAIPCETPGPLDDRTVESMLPRLLDIARDLGLPLPPLRRFPARAGWYDGAGDAHNEVVFI